MPRGCQLILCPSDKGEIIKVSLVISVMPGSVRLELATLLPPSRPAVRGQMFSEKELLPEGFLSISVFLQCVSAETVSFSKRGQNFEERKIK